MTGRGLPSSDSVLHLLHEAGIPADPPLVGAVREISALGTGPAPEASAELAQLMADGGKVPAGRRNKRRITFIGGALAVSMGVGMSGVAAGTPYFPDHVGEAVDSMTRYMVRDSADRIEHAPGPAAGSVAPAVVAPSVPVGPAADATVDRE